MKNKTIPAQKSHFLNTKTYLLKKRIQILENDRPTIFLEIFCPSKTVSRKTISNNFVKITVPKYSYGSMDVANLPENGAKKSMNEYGKDV
jgi:hypothetical protein